MLWEQFPCIHPSFLASSDSLAEFLHSWQVPRLLSFRSVHGVVRGPFRIPEVTDQMRLGIHYLLPIMLLFRSTSVRCHEFRYISLGSLYPVDVNLERVQVPVAGEFQYLGYIHAYGLSLPYRL
jgi:hypothetical protein